MTNGSPRRLASAVQAGLMVVLGTVTVAVVQYFALHTPRGQSWDQRAMESAAVPREATRQIISTLSQVSVGAIAVLLAGLMVFAMLRRRFSLALAAAVLVCGANVTTQVLKYQVLVREDFGYGSTNILPSGHTTVVTSLALAGLIVAPRLGRPIWAFLCSFFITGVGAGVILGRWHRPSDVVAAVGVCLAWAGIGLLFAGYLRRGAPRAAASSSVGRWIRYLLVCLLGAAVVAFGLDRIGLYAIGNTRTAALAGLGLLGCGISAVLSTTLTAAWLASDDDVAPAQAGVLDASAGTASDQ